MPPTKDKGKRVKQVIAGAVTIIAIMVLAVVFNGGITTSSSTSETRLATSTATTPSSSSIASATASTPPSSTQLMSGATANGAARFGNWSAWYAYISKTPTPQTGCFEASFPSVTWQQAQCGPPPKIRLLPSEPETIGYGQDAVAQAPNCCIGGVFGSFQSVVTTGEADNVLGSNSFSLQINSQKGFWTRTDYTGNEPVQGWQQFVFANDYNNVGYAGDFGAQIFVQYWVFNYPGTAGSCPPSIGGIQWTYYNGYSGGEVGCDANSLFCCNPSTSFNPNATPIPTQTVSNLANLYLSAFANLDNTGNDLFVFGIVGGSVYSVVQPANVLDLYEHWTDSEFNVFGFADGEQAVFDPGTTITLQNLIFNSSGGIAPSCVNTGYTEETNNLNYISCSSNASDQIAFTESNTAGPAAALSTMPLTVGVSSGPGSGTVLVTNSLQSYAEGCTDGCTIQELPQTSIVVEAVAGSGYQFGSWAASNSYGTEIGFSSDYCVSSAAGSTCTFTMLTGGARFPGGITLEVAFVRPQTHPFVFTISSPAATPGLSISQDETVTLTFTMATISGTPQPVALNFGLNWPMGTVFSWWPGTAVQPPSANGGTASFTVTISTTCNTPALTYSHLNVVGVSTVLDPISETFPSASSPGFTLSVTPLASCQQPTTRIVITSNPTGSDYMSVDGTPETTPYTATWIWGSTHTVSAFSPVDCLRTGTGLPVLEPGCQYVFTGWTSLGTSQTLAITVSSTSLTTYTANFQKQYQLTVNVNPSGEGSVTISSSLAYSPGFGQPQQKITSSLTEWVDAGAKLTLNAAATSGDNKFQYWNGTGAGSTGSDDGSNPVPITMNSAITETAYF